ncbi:MAG: hypothetical protein ACE5EW_08175, partial [Thermoplasmata archaeon]
PVRKHFGPPAWLDHAEAFLAKWEESPQRVAGPYIEGDRLVVDVRREEPKASRALEKQMGALSLGKNLDRAVKGGFQVLAGDAIAQAGYRTPLTEFLGPDLPWRVTKPQRRT